MLALWHCSYSFPIFLPVPYKYSISSIQNEICYQLVCVCVFVERGMCLLTVLSDRHSSSECVLHLDVMWFINVYLEKHEMVYGSSLFKQLHLSFVLFYATGNKVLEKIEPTHIFFKTAIMERLLQAIWSHLYSNWPSIYLKLYNIWMKGFRFFECVSVFEKIKPFLYCPSVGTTKYVYKDHFLRSLIISV